MNKFTKAIALLLVLAALLSCTGCSSDSDDPYDSIQDSTPGTDVTRTATADNIFSLNYNSNYSFNPLVATNRSNQLVCALVYENMVEVDNNFEALPGVITDWECNEDGTYWTLTIGEGHYFHDGTEVTGKDLRYSLDRAINSDRYSGRFSSYQGSGYDDDYLYVTLGIGDTQFIKLLNIPIIKYGSYAEKYPEGSGPYTYNEDYTALVAYEDYESYDTLPIDTVYLKEYTSAESVISAFDDGIIDVVTNDPSSYTNLGYASTSEIRDFATTNLHYIQFNWESTLGRYDTIRMAMNYAIDRDYFADELLHGKGVASAVPMYPTCAAYPTVLANSLRYNLDTVKIILQNAGLEDYDGDGWLEFMSGTENANLDLIVCSDSSAKTGVCNKLAEDMASIGLQITVRELTWSEYITALEEGDFDMYYGEVKLRNNFDLTELLDPDSSLNYTRSTDQSFVTYINSYLGGYDDADRKTLYASMFDYVASRGGLISIGFETQELIVHRGMIRGLDPNLGNPLYDFANWEIYLDEE
jgi:ABC-type transport system substrate-binding protein